VELAHIALHEPYFPITLSSLYCDDYTPFFFFFFKQKTAYEIGLGIPAEPLFRSSLRSSESLVDGERSQSKSFSSCARIGRIFSRSEERRVGKECRSRWSACH